jgi:hypothetical protein
MSAGTVTPAVTPPVELDPVAISALLGRPSDALKRLHLDRLTPVQRMLAGAFIFVVAVIVATSIEGTLFAQGPSALRIALSNQAWFKGKRVAFPLLSDPVSILAIVSAFLTPFICLRQAQAMQELVPVHRENVTYRATSINWGIVDDATKRANSRFSAIGTKLGSLVCVGVAMSLVLPLLAYVRHVGPLVDVRPNGATRGDWHASVHSGWWANSLHGHASGTVLLDLAGIALYYAVVKQLAMGLVFTAWVQEITKADFGVFPNLGYNSDGYWGMRVVRSLFQWTYASAILHLSLSLLVIALWLPIGKPTLAIAIVIFIADGLFVVYPTMTALRGIAIERREYVANLHKNNGSDQSAEIDVVWQRPMLPFRLRSTSSAVVLYLLIPTAVGVLSSRLGK